MNAGLRGVLALGLSLLAAPSAQGGVLEMPVTSTSAAVGVKEFALFDLPYLFSTEQDADAVLDGVVGAELLDKLPAKGLTGPCHWGSGNERQVLQVSCAEARDTIGRSAAS